jgi:hypothetical protein
MGADGGRKRLRPWRDARAPERHDDHDRPLAGIGSQASIDSRVTFRYSLVEGRWREGGYTPIGSEGNEMPSRKISTIIAELEQEVRALREEVEALKLRASGRSARIEQFAGSSTGDIEWASIHEAIEEQRRHPDPDPSSVPSCGSGTPT